MTTNSGQATFQDRIDPMVEALIKELLETASHPKAASRTEGAITAALTEAFMASLISPARAVSQASSFDKAILAAAMKQAILKALETLVSTKKRVKKTGYKKRFDMQEWQ